MKMTQKEIAEKYGVPQCDVSTAIRYVEPVKPIGERKVVTSSGKTITVNEYDDDKVASVLVKLYLSRSNKHLEKSKEWSKKANIIFLMRMEDI